MFPAARITDQHVCPMTTPNPHIGGVILPAPGPPMSVFIGGLPAATVGSTCVCPGPPNSIVLGSMNTYICSLPAARLTDSTLHGGTVVTGAPTVFIGG